MDDKDDYARIDKFILQRTLGTPIEELINSEGHTSDKVKRILYEQTNKEQLSQFDHRYGFYNSMAPVFSGVIFLFLPLIDPLNQLAEIRLIIAMFGLVTGFLWIVLNFAKMKQSIAIRIYCSTTWSALRKWGFFTMGVMMTLWVPVIALRFFSDVFLIIIIDVPSILIGLLFMYYGIRLRGDYSESSSGTWYQLANNYLLTEKGILANRIYCSVILGDMETAATKYRHTADKTAAFLPSLWVIPLGIYLSQLVGTFSDYTSLTIWGIIVLGFLLNFGWPIVSSLRNSKHYDQNFLRKVKRFLSMPK